MNTYNAFEVNELVYSWKPTSAPILNIEKLSVKIGESLFIQGNSGSGKSTLLNLLSGVLSPQKGKITLLDQPFSSLGSSARDQFRADHIGYIFQQFNLLPYLSVIDNVLLPVKLSALRRNATSKNSPALIEEAKHWLDQLKVPSHLFNETVSRLSIGQQQRVAAARAIIGSPEIIIADEPTSALDHDNVHNFMEVLVNQCQSIKSSLIFVSHDTRLSSYFDHVYSLNKTTTGDSL
ncbi:ABC transporter ATP-binding protein [Reinekea sp.]|jgi:putative ABC transport system ATP-binding protein|uniref:ABC transporter ATP-binding protein n=1 Tax=Reinekea sp. TaxID=1970455 RepID=UPI00398A12C0